MRLSIVFTYWEVFISNTFVMRHRVARAWQRENKNEEHLGEKHFCRLPKRTALKGEVGGALATIFNTWRDPQQANYFPYTGSSNRPRNLVRKTKKFRETFANKLMWELSIEITYPILRCPSSFSLRQRKFIASAAIALVLALNCSAWRLHF